MPNLPSHMWKMVSKIHEWGRPAVENFPLLLSFEITSSDNSDNNIHKKQQHSLIHIILEIYYGCFHLKRKLLYHCCTSQNKYCSYLKAQQHSNKWYNFTLTIRKIWIRNYYSMYNTIRAACFYTTLSRDFHCYYFIVATLWRANQANDARLLCFESSASPNCPLLEGSTRRFWAAPAVPEIVAGSNKNWFSVPSWTVRSKIHSPESWEHWRAG